MDYYWRQRRYIPALDRKSYGRALLQPPNITLKIETQDVLFFFCLSFLKKAEMNGDGPNNAQDLHRPVPVVAAIATTT